jgi:hypothetical protein
MSFPEMTLLDKLDICYKQEDPYKYLFQIYFDYYGIYNPKIFVKLLSKYEEGDIYGVGYIVKNLHHKKYSNSVYTKRKNLSKYKQFLKLHEAKNWDNFLENGKHSELVARLPKKRLQEAFLQIIHFYANKKNVTVINEPGLIEVFNSVKESPLENLHSYLLAIITSLEIPEEEMNKKKIYISLNEEEKAYINSKIELNKSLEVLDNNGEK